jgi:uncharacterized protein (TIGR03437 family)
LGWLYAAAPAWACSTHGTPGGADLRIDANSGNIAVVDNLVAPTASTECVAGIGLGSLSDPLPEGVQATSLDVVVTNVATGVSAPLAAFNFEPSATTSGAMMEGSSESTIDAPRPVFDGATWFGFRSPVDRFELPEIDRGAVIELSFGLRVPEALLPLTLTVQFAAGEGLGDGTPRFSGDHPAGYFTAGTTELTIVSRNAAAAAAVNAASYVGETLATASIVAVFGFNLAPAIFVAETTPLPTELGGGSLVLTDSAGAAHDLPLFFMSPEQANAYVPPGAAFGPALLTANRETPIIAQATPTAVNLGPLGPGLFSADATGQGAAAAVALRIAPGGERTTEFVFDAALEPKPIALNQQDEVYLLLFGTGIRGFSRRVTVTVGGLPVAVLGAQPQSEFVGLDQVNAGPLPLGLAGRGEVAIELTADGMAANVVTAAFE